MNAKTFALLLIMGILGAFAYNDLYTEIEDTRAMIDDLRKENRMLAYRLER